MAWNDEVLTRKRFKFGQNWLRYSKVIDENRISEAIRCLGDFLGVADLSGQSFIDVGCGSGLMSLAAYRMGAQVLSFDFDQQSVECTAKLIEQYCDDPLRWRVDSGSVLDRSYLMSLGTFDIIYSWGVLHHTGKMWEAIGNLSILSRKGTLIYIAIYNYQEHWSKIYYHIKRTYTRSGRTGKLLILGFYLCYTMGIAALFDMMRLKNPTRRYSDKRKQRGMSYFYDAIDWVGGYPFEVARPEEIIEYFLNRGYELRKLKTVGGGLACNEFSFRKVLDDK